MQVEEFRLGEAPLEFWRLADRNGPAAVFYNSELLHLWSHCYGWSSLLLKAANSYLPGYVERRVWGSKFYSLPFGWYGGLLASEPDAAATEALFSYLLEQKYAELSVVSYANAIEPMPSAFESRPLTTHLLDLQAEVPYSENTRRNLTRAEAAELEVSALTEAQVPAALKLLKEHERLTQKPRKIKAAYYDELLRLSLRSDSNVEVLIATRDGDLFACHIYFTSESDIFYLDGFSNDAGRELAANFLLFDRKIQDTCRRGLKRLNFGASPADDEGLRRFKEGWGARPVEYVEYYNASGVKRIVDQVRREL